LGEGKVSISQNLCRLTGMVGREEGTSTRKVNKT